MLKAAYPKHLWDELKLACKERAAWQCEHISTQGKRCRMKEGMLRTGKRGRRYIVYLHAAHLDNTNPGNTDPTLICLCAKHHMQMDRQAELKEKLSTRRRGYQITSTDNLLAEVNSAGVTIQETADGYTWQIDKTGLAGKQTTAVTAIATAIHQMRCLLETTQLSLTHELSTSQ